MDAINVMVFMFIDDKLTMIILDHLITCYVNANNLVELSRIIIIS